MECSALMAISKSRKVPIYQFLYGDDSLADTEWDRRDIDTDLKYTMEKNILSIVLEIANKL